MKETQSAGGVVVHMKGKVLVVCQYGHSWSLPKGHLEDNETPLKAAEREIFEESGINELEYVKELGTYWRYRIGLDYKDDKTQKKIITMFLFKTKQERLKPSAKDVTAAAWLEKEKVAGLLTHRKDRAFFRKIMGEIP